MFPMIPILQLFTVFYYTHAVPILPNVQTGYVPIFGNRMTLEPITFTFTTPSPKLNPMKSFPTLRPFNPSAFVMSLPGPTVHNNNVQEFKYEVQMPTQARPLTFSATTSAYSQAQLYKAMQASLQQDVYATYRTIWKQMSDTWIRLRSQLLDEGVEQDWHVFWQKFTGTVEPYMTTISTQVGRLLNVFLRHQHDRESNLTPKTWG
ncbi:unnamed protein product [Caenorhabditis sp. 36 PRJEB53466]|nr:unnamed protein product [Caenorhabditis sp. 36 PRJEB53466]